MDDNDKIVFSDDENEKFSFSQDDKLDLTSENKAPINLSDDNWKILIVDDEPEIHTLTKLVLKDFEFEGRGLTFLSAYSAKEAKIIIATTPDIALAFMDVIMEDEHAGLDLVKYVRNELKN